MKFCSYKIDLCSTKGYNRKSARQHIARNVLYAVREINKDINGMSANLAKGIVKSRKRG